MSVLSSLISNIDGLAINVTTFMMGRTPDPLRIATNAENNVTITGEKLDGFLGLFSFDYLFYHLKREVFIWAAIVTLFLFITMLFINRSDKIADRKNDILHKLLIVYLASSTLFILTALIRVLDEIF